ncbi:hypothetical protein PAXINDRAFT_41474, partial [Paxillus involutus ATCC 200175]
MPKFLWAEAVSYASWLRNRLPSHLSQAHEFGCKVYVRIQDVGKLEARAEEAAFVGVDEESKGFRVYWPKRHRVSVERNVSFVPDTVVVADDVPVEGESKVVKDEVNDNNAQHVLPP